jgi:hypothetical protein
MASRRNGSRSTARLSQPMLEPLRIAGVEAAINPSTLSVGDVAALIVVGTITLSALILTVIILLVR